MGKYFGTDGIRGVANEDLTPELAYRIGRAACCKLKNEPNKLVVIGKDTRISGDMLEASLVAGITSMGFDVYLLGIIPTPGVAYLTRYYKACCGIVISASHNPLEFNGIKYFGKEGFKLKDEIEEEIEYLIDHIEEVSDRPVGVTIGRVFKKRESKDIYLNYLASRIQVDHFKKKIALDCANGATASFAKELFEKFGAEVIAVHDENDGEKINLNCGSTHPDVIQKLVLESKADLGFSYDGDGDRLIACDEKGNLMDGDHVICACATILKKENKLMNNAVVGTVMTNIGMDEYMKKIGVTVVKTQVGDRYVLEEMLKSNFVIGGEQSGHIIFTNDNTTGDGMLTSLKLAEAVESQNIPLSELNELMVTYPQVLKNAKVSKEFKSGYQEDPVVQDAIRALEEQFQGEGRVLIRPSGTEPLVRVMIEGKDQSVLEQAADSLRQLIEKRSEELCAQ